MPRIVDLQNDFLSLAHADDIKKTDFCNSPVDHCFPPGLLPHNALFQDGGPH